MSTTANKVLRYMPALFDNVMYKHITGQEPYVHIEKEDDTPPKLVRIRRNHYEVRSAQGKHWATYRCSYEEARQRMAALVVTRRLTK